MAVRGGVAILIAALAALAVAVSAAADVPADTTTTTLATTTTPATTAPTTTAVPTTTTTAPATTTATATTAPLPTTTVATRRPTAVRRYAAAGATTLGRGCASSGAAAIVAPGRSPLAVGAAPAQLGAAAYGAVVRFGAASAAGSSCRPGAVSIRGLSLFDGAVTADSVASDGHRWTVAGLHIAGFPVSVPPGSSVAVYTWGVLETGVTVGGTLSAPLAVRLLRSRAGLPAGTVVLVGYLGKAAALAAHKAKRHGKQSRPLKVTPPLGLTGYVFPVSGGAAYVDTYGAHRSDVPGKWHHGDDLIAPLGTPVVAVADGTLSLIGWEKLGGWRLWLTDARGNQFYYAHLAGYSPLALHRTRVRAGEVLGFLGRTGDAFTTTPHLHFEVHPASLLRLGEDGAVDPTTYLRGWRTERARHVPPPVLPGRAPAGVPRQEARVVWRQLLAARGLVHPEPAPPPSLRRVLPDGGVLAAAATVPARPRSGVSGFLLALVVALGLGAAAAASVAALRRLRSPEQGEDVREPADHGGGADVLGGDGVAVLAADAGGAVGDLPVAGPAGGVE